MIRFCAET